MLNWENKQDGIDDVLAEDINSIANSLIETQREIGKIIIDQTYNPESENAQSGKAVAEALSGYVVAEVGKGLSSNDFTNEDKEKLYSALQNENIDQTYTPDSTNAQSGKAVAEAIGTIWSKIYPIGSIYISVADTSPSTLFGGTWVQIKDVFLLSAGDTYAAGSTGGEAEHILTVDEMPRHSHNVISSADAARLVLNQSGAEGASYAFADNRGNGYYSTWITDNRGNDQPHNNMPPYVAFYIWAKVA